MIRTSCASFAASREANLLDPKGVPFRRRHRISPDTTQRWALPWEVDFEYLVCDAPLFLLCMEHIAIGQADRSAGSPYPMGRRTRVGRHVPVFGRARDRISSPAVSSVGVLPGSVQPQLLGSFVVFVGVLP